MLQYEDSMDSREIDDAITDLYDDLELDHDIDEDQIEILIKNTDRELTAEEAVIVADPNFEKLKKFLAIRDEVKLYDGGDWDHGLQLINESYFKEYAKELAEDCGMIAEDNSWPTRCIDWDEAAYELKMDYTPIEILDETYYYRTG